MNTAREKNGDRFSFSTFFSESALLLESARYAAMRKGRTRDSIPPANARASLASPLVLNSRDD